MFGQFNQRNLNSALMEYGINFFSTVVGNIQVDTSRDNNNYLSYSRKFSKKVVLWPPFLNG